MKCCASVLLSYVESLLVLLYVLLLEFHEWTFILCRLLQRSSFLLHLVVCVSIRHNTNRKLFEMPSVILILLIQKVYWCCFCFTVEIARVISLLFSSYEGHFLTLPCCVHAYNTSMDMTTRIIVAPFQSFLQV